jgi:hypothetical protein
MLFPLSRVALPLCLYLRREPEQRFITRLAAFLARHGMIFVLAIPLAPMSALPDIGGKNPFYYLTLFIYGYVLMADARFAEALDRHKIPALILGLSLLLVLFGMEPLADTSLYSSMASGSSSSTNRMRGYR